MNKRLVSSCIALVATLTLLAPAAWSEDVTPEIASGAKAGLFTLSGLQILGALAYDGGIGFKYYLMDPLALRASLQFGVANEAIPGPTGGTDGNLNSFDIGLSAGAEYHFLKTRVSPYAGASLGFLSTSTENKSPVAAGATATVIKNAVAGELVNGSRHFGGFNFNIAALGGVEFFLIKELSLSAEYRLGWSIITRYDEVSSVPGSIAIKSGAVNTFGITSVGAFTLAFYF
jgi:hypothetical protein